MTIVQAMNRIRFKLTEELSKIEKEAVKAIVKEAGLQVYQGHRVLKSTGLIQMTIAREMTAHSFVMLTSDYDEYKKGKWGYKAFDVSVPTNDLDHLFDKNGRFPKPVTKVYTAYRDHWKPYTLLEAELLSSLGHPIE